MWDISYQKAMVVMLASRYVPEKSKEETKQEDEKERDVSPQELRNMLGGYRTIKK